MQWVKPAGGGTVPDAGRRPSVEQAMTAATDETAGGRGRNGKRLCGLAVDAFARGGLGDTMARDRTDRPVIGQNGRLPMMESALESSESC